jgi:hypothetical protein
MAADCFVPDRTATRVPFVPALFGLERLRDEVADFAVDRFVANFVMGISFGSIQPSGCTAKAPQ